MDEEKLILISEQCEAVMRNGFTNSMLSASVRPYRDLEAEERFRVQVLLCKSPGLAYAALDDLFRFHLSKNGSR
jgi:hypothetical protein